MNLTEINASESKDGLDTLDAMPVDGRITLRTLKERVQQVRNGEGTDRGEVER